jgi:hypothetical protein
MLGAVDMSGTATYPEFVTKGTNMTEQSFQGREATRSVLDPDPGHPKADVLVVYPYRRFLAMQAGTISVAEFVEELADHVERQLPTHEPRGPQARETLQTTV